MSDLANSRAGAFEDQVQGIVDRTAWKPPPPLAAIGRKTLRRNGRAITDVDAIGAKEGSLLLVSCKSVIYDREYDRGEFRVVRNVQTRVDDGVRDWLEITADLLRDKGDNFDFTAFGNAIAVVCTPFVVYSDNPVTLEWAEEGLRRCSSASELKAWLDR